MAAARTLYTSIFLLLCLVGSQGEESEPNCQGEDDAPSGSCQLSSGDCLAYDPEQPTVLYRSSGGRLGNWMYVYFAQIVMQIRYEHTKQ